MSTSLLALVLLVGLVKPRFVLPRCTYSETSGVVSNIRLDGKLVRGWRDFGLQDGSGNEHTLAKCRNGSCSKLYRQLQETSTGAPIYAEFCGPFLTFLSVNYVPVHTSAPPTQARIDKEAAEGRWIGLLALIYLVMVCAGVAMHAVKKTRKARLGR